jgi:hypothetical protein
LGLQGELYAEHLTSSVYMRKEARNTVAGRLEVTQGDRDYFLLGQASSLFLDIHLFTLLSSKHLIEFINIY